MCMYSANLRYSLFEELLKKQTFSLFIMFPIKKPSCKLVTLLCIICFVMYGSKLVKKNINIYFNDTYLIDKVN